MDVTIHSQAISYFSTSPQFSFPNLLSCALSPGTVTQWLASSILHSLTRLLSFSFCEFLTIQQNLTIHLVEMPNFLQTADILIVLYQCQFPSTLVSGILECEVIRWQWCRAVSGVTREMLGWKVVPQTTTGNHLLIMGLNWDEAVVSVTFR